MYQDTLQSKVFILIINDTGSMFIEDFKGDVIKATESSYIKTKIKFRNQW